MGARWPSLLDVSVRGFARAIDDADLSEARAWAGTACAILAAEREATRPQQAWLDALEADVAGVDPQDPCQVCSRPIPAAETRLKAYCSRSCRSAFLNYLTADERARWGQLNHETRIRLLDAGRARARARDRARRDTRTPSPAA